MSAPATRAVPVRTIAASIGMVLLTLAAIYTIDRLAKVITWLVIAAFFALLLSPAVDFLERRTKIPRTLAAFMVFLVGVALVAALLYAFIRPLVDQAGEFSNNLPKYVEDAKNGQGTIGRLVRRFNVDGYVESHQEQLRSTLSNAGAPAARLASSVFSTLFAVVTILVLTILMLLQGPRILDGIIHLVPDRLRERVRRVGRDCNRAVAGYMGGNLLISVIAGVATYLFLIPLGVPFRGVLALWVAFADLIPLVGATLGAAVVSSVAFLHSPRAGVAAIIFFVIYQQFENHVLSVTIMSRTVDLNPLAVLVSVLIGVELFGVLGALLAIPVAGIIQVILRDIYDENRMRLKEELSIGEDEVPLSEVKRDEADAKAEAEAEADEIVAEARPPIFPVSTPSPPDTEA